MTFKDHFSGHAANYASHRPTYPPALFELLANLCSRRSLAWDCATGNGQAAASLARSFDRVIATDASSEQVASAAELPKNVDLYVAPAEESGIAPGSVDLVTVAQALHWFDFDAFYAEVDRVLAPRGILAVWSYGLTRISPTLDTLVDAFYRGEIDEYWPPERTHVDNQYRDVPFPFEEVENLPKLAMTAEWSAHEFLSYLGTWSSVRRCIAATGRDPIDRLKPDLLAEWGEEKREVRWPLTLRVGRHLGN